VLEGVDDIWMLLLGIQEFFQNFLRTSMSSYNPSHSSLTSSKPPISYPTSRHLLRGHDPDVYLTTFQSLLAAFFCSLSASHIALPIPYSFTSVWNLHKRKMGKDEMNVANRYRFLWTKVRRCFNGFIPSFWFFSLGRGISFLVGSFVLINVLHLFCVLLCSRCIRSFFTLQNPPYLLINSLDFFFLVWDLF